MVKTLKRQHTAISAPIADLITRRAIPTRTIDYLDPFLFLNHHGPQRYPANNRGLPFGPHPHRGFETVTFILDGDIAHKDTGGAESVIQAGGIQWMTAGSGLIHAEISSDAFKAAGGDLEILQLWINLPARLKMTKPAYTGLQKDAIPVVEANGGRVQIQVISGDWDTVRGPVTPLTDVALSTLTFQKEGKLTVDVAMEQTVFFYIIRGSLRVNGEQAGAFHLLEFNHDGAEIEIEALTDAVVLFGHATPYDEPVVSQGPFVMNTEAEIHVAYADYRAGRLGVWK